jgi:hypothetical protein
MRGLDFYYQVGGTRIFSSTVECSYWRVGVKRQDRNSIDASRGGIVVDCMREVVEEKSYN